MEIRLRTDDATQETIEVQATGPRQFRLNATAVLAPDPLYWGDVIEAEFLADGTHRLARIVERAPLRHHSWVVAKGFVGSPDYHAFRRAVEASGGHVEALFGGVLFAHVPQAAGFDAEAELDRYLSSDWPEA